MNKLYRKDRQEFVNKIKDLPCQDCGGRFDPECMDFDHRDAEIKSFEIGARMLGKGEKSLRKFMLEVSKCDLVCANCHRLRTKCRRNAVAAVDLMVRQLPSKQRMSVRSRPAAQGEHK